MDQKAYVRFKTSLFPTLTDIVTKVSYFFFRKIFSMGICSSHLTCVYYQYLIFGNNHVYFIHRVQIGKWDTMIGGKGMVLGIARHIDMNAIILAFNTSPNISTANFQPGRVLFWLGHHI